MRRLRALALAAALLAWSAFVAPRVPPRPQAVVQAVLAGVLVRGTRARLGLAPPRLWSGLRYGVPLAAVVSAAVAGSTRIPAVRRGMAARELPAPTLEWLLWRIPMGTVWSEEAAFRGALGTLTDAAFGRRWGLVLQAATFGGKHVADARSAGESVVGTVAVTGVAGLAFGWLYGRSGSLAASMLAHLAVNEAGAVAALWVQRRR
ncbi:Rv0804 family intramembrane glutamic endopeptidase [Mycolicibacterium sediminis]|uniref:CAAX protease family protein n=1 Tax=Mycolicibacterium sediminis TaxID=1286180 RepID=A0A7I7QI82_9MYCO|nr:CPBP family intramembrane glutamic endopeptidase [Mycolicibacterium sediminis]BBY25974.1 CAAX protease family protein [Mycolicibacterium sediminis]